MQSQAASLEQLDRRHCCPRTCALCRNLLRLAFFSAGVRLASTSTDCCCVPATDAVQQRQARPCSACYGEEARGANVSQGERGTRRYASHPASRVRPRTASATERPNTG